MKIHKNINKEILHLAIPNILSNISIPLLSTVDTALMGHLSADHLGAVGIGSMIFNFIYWNFGFLRMGTTGITAQSYGARDRKGTSLIFFRAIFIAFAISIILLLFQGPICRISIHLMNVMSDQTDLVSEYFMIRILAAPATMALYVLLGWFFGMQNALYPLIITVLVNVLNLVLSYVLVMNFDMGISGVAYGTVAAQYFGVIIGVGLILYRYRSKIHIEWFEICSQWAEWMAILKVNSNLFIRTVSLTFVFGFFYAKSSASGEMVLAANVILLQFLNWMSYGIDGFAYASESLVGKYFGAKSTSNLSRTIKLSFAWGGGLALLYSVVFLVFGSSIIRIFTDDSAIFDYTFDRLWWIAVLPIIAFACYIWDGIYIGLTAARQMRDTMLISVLVYLGTYFALSLYDKEVIWWSLAIFLFFRGFIQSIYWMAEKELKTVRDSISKGVIY